MAQLKGILCPQLAVLQELCPTTCHELFGRIARSLAFLLSMHYSSQERNLICVNV